MTIDRNKLEKKLDKLIWKSIEEVYPYNNSENEPLQSEWISKHKAIAIAGRISRRFMEFHIKEMNKLKPLTNKVKQEYNKNR